MRIGRRRVRGRFDDGVEFVAALLLELVGKLHDQDAVLGDEADERDEPDLAVDVHGGEAAES